MRIIASAALLFLALALVAGWPRDPSAGLAEEPVRIVPANSVSGAEPDPAPNEITIRLKEGASDRVVQRLHRRLGVSVLSDGERSGVQRLRLPKGMATEQALAAYGASGLVAEAGPSRTATILERPDDPNFQRQWHFRSTEGGAWVDTAWDLAPAKGQGIVVAVIDTGVAYEDHDSSLNGFPQAFKRVPDLANTSFVAPWDFTQDEAHANDDHGHGTHVAGTIAQSTDNGRGGAGVAYRASIMPLKALDYTGNGTDGAVVEAIYYAVDNGADVINMSLGWPESGAPDGNGNVCTKIVGLTAALDYAYTHGVTVVAAAGNDGGNTVLCPAAYPTVVAVAATRYDGTVTSYSNKGAALDIAAPGGDPFVDQDGDGYTDGVLQESFCYNPALMLFYNLYGYFCQVYNAGTSMASPHVAGSAALLLGEDGTLGPDGVRGLLQSTARDGGAPGWDTSYGHGLLDAAGAVAALKGVSKPVPTPVPGLEPPSNLTATAVSSSRINLSWSDNASAEAGFKVERSTDGVSFAHVASLGANVTSWSNTLLSANSTYHYRVRAFSGADNSAPSNIASATTFPPPAAPTDLTAIAVSSSRINLSWTDNATNEQGFKLERATDGGSWLLVAYLGSNVTSFASTNLPASTTYHFRVRAYEGPNHSAYSNIASATTQPAPAAPSGLSATAVSSSRIDLAWTDNATNEQGLKVERSTDGVSWLQVLIAGANATSVSNTNLAASTTFHYRVRAYDGPNNSAYSNVATATTQPPPAAPSNVTATAVSSSRIDVRWTDNATNEQGFKLERSTDGVNFSQYAYLLPNTTLYTNNFLSPGTTYYYRLRAYDGPNHSPYSNVASATTAQGSAAPSNLAATAVSSSRINLSWTDNSSSEGGFKVERSTDGATFVQVAVLSANITSWSNTFLTASTTYHYRVRAYEGTNHSGYSNTASATTLDPPAAPTNLTATSTLTGRVDLRWTDNSTGEQGFKVERSTDGTSWTHIASLPANTTSYANGGLVSGQTYHYRVRAYDGPNNSGYSNVATVTVR